MKISDSEITENIPNYFPNNLQILIKEKDSPKTYSDLRPKFSSLPNFQSILSFITFISGMTAISLTLMIYFINLLISNVFSKISFILLSSFLTLVSVFPVFLVLFTFHGYICDFLSIFFAINNNNNNNTHTRNLNVIEF